MAADAKPAEHPLDSTLRHRRQSFWQIIFPVIVVTGLLIAGVVLLYLQRGPAGTSIVADYALILLSLPALLLGLLALALVAGLIFAAVWVTGKVAPVTNGAQRTMQQVYLTVDDITNKIASVLIGLVAALGGFANIVQKYGLSPDGDRVDSAE